MLKKAAEDAESGAPAAPVVAPKKSFGVQDWLNEHRFVAVMSNLIIYALVSGGIFGWIEVRSVTIANTEQHNIVQSVAGPRKALTSFLVRS